VHALLVPSPDHFVRSGNIVRNINAEALKPYAVIHRDIQAEFRVLGRGDKVIVVLNRRLEDDFFSDLGLTVYKYNDGQY
jgi:stringent starvation protein B